jgi:poly(A)-specific ribonuclease
MIVNKDNYQNVISLFKESLEKCDFIAFDCEMSGITYDLRTEGTKYDTHELRYLKCKEIVKKFDLIQFGLTFYLKNQNNPEKEIYIERTFNFSLFKNSKLKFLTEVYSNDSKMSLFSSIPLFHPGSLKFLNENKFDFNAMINKGIHFNKLGYEGKIRKLLDCHFDEGKLPGNIVFLSKSNEGKVIEVLKDIMKFLLETNEVKQASNIDKAVLKKRKIGGLNMFIMNYILSMNLKGLFKISQYNLFKDKTATDTLIIEKSKANLTVNDFYTAYGNFENFAKILTPDLVFKTKYQNFILEKEKVDEIVDDELGFSKFINLVIGSGKPIIGHNLYYDLMFMYEKFIDDLPDTFWDYKSALSKYFPQIYDTKFITSKYAKEFDNTKLESIYKLIKKNKYDSYVQITPDVINGFCNYIDVENSFHDAGFDSVITGRCYIYLLKAIENSFEKDFTKSNNGYIDFSTKIVADLKNKSCISLIQEPYDIYYLTADDRDLFETTEKKIINLHSKVYIVKLKEANPTIYEVANTFENDYFNIAVVKIHDNIAYIELINNFLTDEESHAYSEELLKSVADRLDGIVGYNEFIKDPKKYIGL